MWGRVETRGKKKERQPKKKGVSLWGGHGEQKKTKRVPEKKSRGEKERGTAA